MSVVNKEIKFSSKIQTDDSFNVFKKYHETGVFDENEKEHSTSDFFNFGPPK